MHTTHDGRTPTHDGPAFDQALSTRLDAIQLALESDPHAVRRMVLLMARQGLTSTIPTHDGGEVAK